MIRYGKLLLKEYQAGEVEWAKAELVKYVIEFEVYEVDESEVIIWFEEKWAMRLPEHLGTYFYRVEKQLPQA